MISRLRSLNPTIQFFVCHHPHGLPQPGIAFMAFGFVRYLFVVDEMIQRFWRSTMNILWMADMSLLKRNSLNELNHFKINLKAIKRTTYARYLCQCKNHISIHCRNSQNTVRHFYSRSGLQLENKTNHNLV